MSRVQSKGQDLQVHVATKEEESMSTISKNRSRSRRNTAAQRSHSTDGGKGKSAKRGAGQSGRSEPRYLTYSKWIDSSDDHEECKGQSLATLNHDVIRQWAVSRKGVPSAVDDTEGQDGAGVLRIDFPGYGGKRLEKVDWNEWFDTFYKRQFVFLYQEHKRDGSTSTFFKLTTK